MKCTDHDFEQSYGYLQLIWESNRKWYVYQGYRDEAKKYWALYQEQQDLENAEINENDELYILAKENRVHADKWLALYRGDRAKAETLLTKEVAEVFTDHDTFTAWVRERGNNEHI